MKYKNVPVFKTVLGLVSKFRKLHPFVRYIRDLVEKRLPAASSLPPLPPLLLLGRALENFLQQRRSSWRKISNMPLIW